MAALFVGAPTVVLEMFDPREWLRLVQEHRVTVSGRMFPLPSPFFVLATQNPIEQEGTYSLPEAQLDRFMFFIHVDYPTKADERRIARETTGASPAPPVG